MLQYLGVRPSKQVRFEPAFYSAGAMSETVQSISNIAPDGSSKNRRGILLGNAATLQTRTLTPTLWSLLNTIGPKSDQKPHKHNSVALDLAVVGSAEGELGSERTRDPSPSVARLTTLRTLSSLLRPHSRQAASRCTRAWVARSTPTAW